MSEKKVILASTSTLFGEPYLHYLKPVITRLFEGIDEIVFVPFARPGGIGHAEYTELARTALASLGIRVKGLHEFDDMAQGIESAKGFFTGGGNTFLLVKQLHEHRLMDALKEKVETGTPYLGTSAGSNIGGINMKTTNDMPIVYPPDFRTMGLVPFNINPHYLDPDPLSKHNGETRETRIKEFHTQNDIPVVGLREGNWIAINGKTITVEGAHLTRIFEMGKEAREVPSGTLLNWGAC